MIQCPCCDASFERLPWLGATPAVPVRCASCGAQLYVSSFWLSTSISVALLVLAIVACILTETLWPALGLLIVLAVLIPVFRSKERLARASPRMIWVTRIAVALLAACALLPDLYRAVTAP